MRFGINKNNFSVLLIAMLFIVGIIFPTSFGGIINRNLTMLVGAVAILGFALIILAIDKTSKYFLFSMIATNLVLWSITLFNNSGTIERSAAIFFLLVTLMFCLNLKQLHGGKRILMALNLINIIVIFLGFMLIMKNTSVGNLMIMLYSDFYPELLPNMVERGKPVVTFATHSIAGFYMFVLFYLNYKVYLSKNKIMYLLFSLVYLYFCLELQSNTSLFFLGLGLIVLFLKVKRKGFFIAKWALPAIGGYFVFKDKIMISWEKFKYDIMTTTYSSSNGFLGRYSEGVQSENIQHIFSNPFSAIGFAVSNSEVVLYDSGIIVTIVRGTILLLVLIYGTFYFFFKKNIVNKYDALFLFFIFFIFETGFNNLYYFRTIMIIPFIIVLLNYLEAEKNSIKEVSV